MKKKLLVSMFAIALAVPFNLALAMTQEEIQSQREENRQAIQEQREKNKEAVEAQREKRLEQRCKNIQTRITTRINRYENNGHMFETVFGNMLARLERLATRLKSKDVDVNKLETDLATLKEKINNLLEDQKTFMETLTNASGVTCTEADRENSTETKAKIGEARKVIATLRQDRLDIRNFFQSTIKPDIMAIRKQLEEKKATTDDNDNDEKATTETTTTTIQ